MKKEICVSIIMITYGHEKFIEEAIEGVRIQKCNFNIELIIADDNSSDNTEGVVNNYLKEKKFTENIQVRYFKHKINKGANENYLWAVKQSNGKYIANCEGDDYWIDPLKLQKQVDFLENNPEYVISCHNSNIVDGDGNFKKLFNKFKIPETTETNYLITEPWYMPTASVVFRKNHLSFPEWYFKVKNGDYALYLLLTYKKNLIHYNNVVMSAYRIHGKGVSNIFKRKNVYSHSMIFIHQNFNDFSKKKYDENCLKNISYHSYKILNNTSVYSKEFWFTLTNLILYKRRVDKKLLYLLKRRLLKKIKFNYIK